MPGFISFEDMAKNVVGETGEGDLPQVEIDSRLAAKAENKLENIKDLVEKVILDFQKAGMKDAEMHVAERLRSAGLPRPESEAPKKGDSDGDKKAKVAILIKKRLKEK